MTKGQIEETAVSKFGTDKMLDNINGSLSGLINEISNYKCGYDNHDIIIEKTADVIYMTEYIKFIFGITDKELENKIIQRNKIFENLIG